MTTYPNLKDQGLLAIDIETNDPDLLEKGPGVRRDAYIVGVAVATEAGFKAYYPVAHERGVNLPRDKVFGWLKRELARPGPKIGTNLLYDLDFLSAVGVEVAGPHWDIMVAEPLIDENQRRYSLEAQAQKYLKRGKLNERLDAWIVKNLGVKQNAVKKNIWRAPAEVVAPYAIGDVTLPIRIFKKQRAILNKLGLWELFELESSLIPMLLAMRQRGVAVDVKKAEQLFEELTLKQSALSLTVGVDPWNAADIGRLYDKMGIAYPRTAKTKAPSFTKQWLAQDPNKVSQTINEIRHLDKLRNTFIKGFILDGHTNGRIHCQFNQLKGDDNGTVTGRFSSSTPNMQQIPARSFTGKLIRSLFIPDRKGDLWGKTDYSQIEYRLMANEAIELELDGYEDVQKAYQNDDADFHQIIADMTGLDRNAAKTINFGIAYGEGVNKLCAALGLDRKAGFKLLDEYHTRAPFMKPLMKQCMKEAQDTGMIHTMFNRTRHFDKMELTDARGEQHVFDNAIGGAKRAFTYKALNARIQGTAADILKIALRDIWKSGVISVLGVPQLIVHDEIDVSVPNTKIGREAFYEMKHIMETCVKLHIPVRVDASLGPSWGEVK